ncbi:MAG: tripartite tricarboxylate transporter substrate binding protein [Betaproteobacteria bacterium]|nr:tripartite tricarboxylate transporter substrate binding protein [Betaproteobacteria bacterium]
MCNYDKLWTGILFRVTSFPAIPARRNLRAGVIAFLALSSCLSVGSTWGQNYPTASMRFVVPFAPGGGTDILGRVIAQKLNERFGQPVVVDNRTGANGSIGTAFVAKAPPDGHTILLQPAGYLMNPFLYKNLPYDQARDLAPVSQLASGPLLLVVHPSVPARSVKELIALAKSRPDALNYGSSGIGSLGHICAELFKAMSGISMNHIPYKGAGAVLIDVMGGQVSVYIGNILSILPQAKAGKLRALGVTTQQRSPIAPDLPTIAEAGLPNFEMINWYGMLIPAGTPREVISKLQQEVARILNLPELKERLAAEGMTVVASTPEQFAEFMTRETAKYARIIQTAGITAE